MPGLHSAVSVIRDRWGIAHIEAENAHDLFFAQGFVVAQDRLFQIELWRRTGFGEMAELHGEEALEGDKFARLMLYRGNMDAEWRSYAPDAREIATAFADGINAFITQAGEKGLPVEFQMLGFKPRPYSREVSTRRATRRADMVEINAPKRTPKKWCFIGRMWSEKRSCDRYS